VRACELYARGQGRDPAAGCGLVVAAVTGCVAFGVELAWGGRGMAGGAEAVVAGITAGALAALSAPAAATAGLPRPSVAANTPAAAMAARATSTIDAVIRPVRKLISSSRALTAARRRGRVRAHRYPPTFTATHDTDKGRSMVALHAESPANQAGSIAGRGLPGATVLARIPSVARSALSGTTGKIAASFQLCSAADQS
jgi:hypothetical protein